MQQRQENGDAQWIRPVTGDGFAIISCDLAIVDNADERAAVVESRARIVGFAKADYNRWDMMRGLCRHWLSIEGHLQRPPVVLKVQAGSKAPVRLDLGDRAQAMRGRQERTRCSAVASAMVSAIGSGRARRS